MMEPITEETCVCCEETKTDEFYYNLTPKKNAPVCTACRDREETCRCCEIKYPYYQIKHDGGGKYLCITCDNECPCADTKCGSICPAVANMLNALASNSSSSNVTYEYAVREVEQLRVGKLKELMRKEKQELEETGK